MPSDENNEEEMPGGQPRTEDEVVHPLHCVPAPVHCSTLPLRHARLHFGAI